VQQVLLKEAVHFYAVCQGTAARTFACLQMLDPLPACISNLRKTAARNASCCYHFLYQRSWLLQIAYVSSQRAVRRASQAVGPPSLLFCQCAIKHLLAVTYYEVVFSGQVDEGHDAFADSQERAVAADKINDCLQVAKLIFRKACSDGELSELQRPESKSDRLKNFPAVPRSPCVLRHDLRQHPVVQRVES
jgi:hypothetical protein